MSNPAALAAAEAYADEAAMGLHEDCVRDFLAGHAAALGSAPVQALVSALEDMSKRIARPISMTDALMQLSELEGICERTLKAWSASAAGRGGV